MAVSERRESADLIVVGASVGGLVAAVTAADHGHRVVLLERTKELGGTAVTEPEVIAAAGSRFQRVAGIDDAPKHLLADLAAAAGHRVSDEMAGALAEQGAALVEWLSDRCGVVIGLQSTTPSGGHARTRLHGVGDQGGASLIPFLGRAASHHTHIRVRTLAEVERLLRDDTGAVTGVALKPDRRSATIITGPVLLACGGFVASDELVAEHCPGAAALPHLGGTGGKGDGLRLAAAAGAATRDLSACSVTPLLAQPSHLAITRMVIELGGVLVNQVGQRFANEMQAPLSLALALRAQPGRVAYLLFDERIAAATSAADPFFARVALPRTSRRGASIGMLAKQLELAEQGITLTLEAYNAARGGGGDAFGREPGGAPIEPPLYGIRVTGARRATLGGLAVDVAGRVLDATGAPIPGLYAVGGAAAGFVTDVHEGGLTGLEALAALGLGRLAALGLGVVPDDER